MIFLDLDALFRVAHRSLGGPPEVRDIGLLESALARPQASAFGADAYTSIHEKASALLHSIARNHALVDGNKRVAMDATIAFYGLNGLRFTFTNDEAYDLVIAVASGELSEIREIAARLERGTEPRS